MKTEEILAQETVADQWLFKGKQGRSLTMGREGSPLQYLAQTIVKIGLGPPLFQLKGVKNDFGSQGPSSFKSVTTPLHNIPSHFMLREF